jgi:hypothetical protein
MDRPHFKVANWAEYQHYKDRNPPWIKLHRQLVTSEMWVSCDDASRVLAIACMVIAAEFEGCVPANPDYIMRRCYLSQPPDFKPLVDSGFLIDASGLLAACKQDASTMLAQRQRREEKRREETDSCAFSKRECDADFDEFWSAYPKKRSKEAALKAWKKLKPGKQLKEQIIEAVNKQAKDPEWHRENGQYIPYPATWLNAGGWQDEGTQLPERDNGPLPF